MTWTNGHHETDIERTERHDAQAARWGTNEPHAGDIDAGGVTFSGPGWEHVCRACGRVKGYDAPGCARVAADSECADTAGAERPVDPARRAA